MLRTFLLAKEVSVSENTILVESSLDDEIQELVGEIVHSAETKTQLYEGRDEEVAVWDDDLFSTADAIISLSRYIESEKKSRKPSQAEHLTEIVALLRPALRFLELEQVDGKWGVEESTTVALLAYVLGSKATGEDHPPEPHIVFKAIRYLCDPQTVFADGSIAHKTEPTIYMILAFLEVLEDWDLPNGLFTEKSVHELYDYIIWNTPTRSTHERIKRMKIQSEAASLRIQNSQANEVIKEVATTMMRWRAISFLLIWGLMGFLISDFLRFVTHGRNVTLPFLNEILSKVVD
jgi:hypothetical protein